MLHRIVVLLALALLCATQGKPAGAQTTPTPVPEIIPFLQEVSYNAERLETTAVYGYVNTTGQTIVVPIANQVGIENVFSPPPGFRGQLTRFQPGVNLRAFLVTFRSDLTPTLTWIFRGQRIDARNDPALYTPFQPRITQLETQLAAERAAANSLLDDVSRNYGMLFAEPAFVVPGLTTIDGLVTLRAALLSIGHGTKYALYRRLGGRN